MNIEFVGKFFDNHSLSIINRYIALHLSKNVNISITPLDKVDPSHKVDKSHIKDLLGLINKPLDSVDIQIRHGYPPLWRWPTNPKTKIIYIQPWEFSKIPSEWQHKFDTFADHIIVPSNWTKNVYLDTGINPEKVTVIPNGYNPDVFNNKNRKRNRKFTFTFVGCPQFRKGLDILINAFSKSFVKADLVRLLVKDTPSVYGENGLLSELLRMQYLTEAAEVTLIDDNLSELDMAEMYKETDVLVHPYRGEGFGMHIQEAMACGAFPLVSGGGATDDFVDESCGLRLNVRRSFIDLTNPKVFATKPGDSLSNMSTHSWILEPDEQDLSNKMKFLYHHHERNTILQKVETASKLTTWEQAASMYKDLLTKIYNDNASVVRR